MDAEDMLVELKLHLRDLERTVAEALEHLTQQVERIAEVAEEWSLSQVELTEE